VIEPSYSCRTHIHIHVAIHTHVYTASTHIHIHVAIHTHVYTASTHIHIHVAIHTHVYTAVTGELTRECNLPLRPLQQSWRKVDVDEENQEVRIREAYSGEDEQDEEQDGADDGGNADEQEQEPELNFGSMFGGALSCFVWLHVRVFVCVYVRSLPIME
jgi:hypothetical protein